MSSNEKTKGMRVVEIYEFQLDTIHNALRIVANAYNCRTGKTSLDRQVRQAEQFAKNALEGEKDKKVKYI